MAHQQHLSCIEACDQCAMACNHCAAACLQEADVKMMARCIAFDIDCAEVCKFASAAMSRGSEHVQAICGLCADLCDACGEECAKHQMDHCQECANACRRCAQECRRMSPVPREQGQATSAGHAH
ncbi:four-helix bundle copper-binding protein [Sphaerotilaceae bacterium SBD11-9]